MCAWLATPPDLRWHLELAWTRDSRHRAVTRTFRSERIVCTDAAAHTYRLVGSASDRPDSPAGRFVRVYRGVLVGSGPLNNGLLDLVVELRERAGGTAAARIVEARVSKR